MSVKLPKRPSSKKKKTPWNNAQTEILTKLGLDASSSPLEPASMLDISTWNLGNEAPQKPKDLPNAFLHRLWLLSPDARSPCYKPPHDGLNNDNTSPQEMTNGTGEETKCDINPLDLVTAVFMSANTFLQQEITPPMVQCQFAVPLVLPNIDPDEAGRFLLSPLRSVVSQWMSHSPGGGWVAEEGDLASTPMAMVSCVKFGRSRISKSKVLNSLMGGLISPSQTFVHWGMDGGQLPERLSNGLVEIGWYRPTGDTAGNRFPVPVVFSNLRGEASTQEKHLTLLCQASSAVIVFCGNLREKDKQLLGTCKSMANKLILIDLSEVEENGNRIVGFVDQNLEKGFGLPRGSVIIGRGLGEEDLTSRLCDTLRELISENLKPVTLETAAKLAVELGLDVDEGEVCKKAMATVEEVLKGLDMGSAQFRAKQLPLQAHIWSKLAKIEKQESKLKKEGKEIDTRLQKEKTDILVALSSYKMTPAMKAFTDALSTTDKVERTCFLRWMKLKLQLMQTEKHNSSPASLTNLQTEKMDDTPVNLDDLANEANDDPWDSDSFFTESTFEEEETEDQLAVTEVPINLPGPDIEQQSSENGCNEEGVTENQASDEEDIFDPDFKDQNHNMESEGNETMDDPEVEQPRSDSVSSDKPVSLETQTPSCPLPFQPNPSHLGLEHFFREMALIFELTYIDPGRGRKNVSRLPSLATDLLFHGIPLELMDGDASNIPIHWLSCVFAKLKRRLPQEQCKIRVLTSLGVHEARNAEVLSALFGVMFPEGRRRSTRGIYMVALCLPENLRNDMGCDLLLLIDVEGLCTTSPDNRNILIQDNEMATLATGLSDVLMHNIASHTGPELESNLTVLVNGLLRVKEHGSVPVCQLLIQDEDINSILQASQLKRVSEMLQTREKETDKADGQYGKTPSHINCIRGPWHNMSQSKQTDPAYSEAVLKLKQNLFGALKNCAAKSRATSLSQFMSRLCSVWEAVKADSFSIGLQNTDLALAFSLLCTEVAQWEDAFLDHMEKWFTGASDKIFTSKAKALDAATQRRLLSELKSNAKTEIKTEVDKLRSKIEAHLIEDVPPKISTFKPILMSNMDDLQQRETRDIMQRLETVQESHCSSTQLQNFEMLLAEEQEIRLQALVEISKSTKVLLQDTELEEEFEGVWSKTVSNFDFRPSETDNITARVTKVLKENLISRGLLKHIKKLEDVGGNQTSDSFRVYDEHFGYRSRLKHMFDDNNRLQRLEAQQVACNILEEYNQFVTNKSSLAADFSDSYITELLEMVENTLKEKSMEIKTAFEVDLKVHICRAACQDFQKLHDRFAKDKELLACITASKNSYMGHFIYKFRKRDQCQRIAQTFTSMVIKPVVLDYIYSPLEKKITEEILGKAQQYQSPRAFHLSLLEELVKEDCFENFPEYLLSYDDFRLRKVQETVVAHVAELPSLDEWRQQRLGEIVGKVSAAVSQTAVRTNGVLSDTKPLLESALLTLERDGDVDVDRSALDGPLFSITTKWDRFVTCLMELLAAMRLDLAQEFSQNGSVDCLLQCLTVQPQDSLLNRVTGCDKRCPLCRAPCELEERGHEIHRARLHRPKGLLPLDSCSSSRISCSESTEHMDTNDIAVASRDLASLYPDWSFSPGDPHSQMPNAYWRYVLVRFNYRFASHYKQDPAEIPEEWRKISEEEALHSLKEAFHTA